MKPTLILLSCACCLLPLAVPAAVPLTWTVETSRATPAQFEAYQGETLAFEAALQSHGKPLEMSGLAAFYWQTNGMGSAYWQTSAAVNSNRLSAVFTPEMDVGARVYNCFIGSPSNIYHAAFQLRLRPSPGAIPNVLPLPVPILDFAKVTVLNAPWPTDTQVRAISQEEIAPATNRLYKSIIDAKDGEARPLPRYLHCIDFDDCYTNDAAWYYAQPQPYAACSAVRDGGYLYRNYDWLLDDAAEFVVRVSAGPGRFASVGVANCGTNLTERFVTSGKWSRYYKCLPGRTVDGINERGVVAEINVVDDDPQTSGWHTGGDIHPLAAVRWALDHGTSAAMVASNLAARVAFPQGWSQNFHYMIADAEKTYIVENGTASNVTAVAAKRVMTNFPILPDAYEGTGKERYDLLFGGETITNAWYTRAYSPSSNWASEFKDIEEQNAATNGWAHLGTKEARRATGAFWQTVHTSVYDLANRTLRISVQETDDWYTFAVPVTGGVKSETDPTVPAWAKEPNPPPSMTAEEAAEIANHAISTNAATTNLTARLEKKANASDLSSHIDNTNNPHRVTAVQVGALPSVDPYDQYARVYWGNGSGPEQYPYGLHVESPYVSFDTALEVYAPYATLEANWGKFMSLYVGSQINAPGINNGYCYFSQRYEDDPNYIDGHIGPNIKVDGNLHVDGELHLYSGDTVYFGDHDSPRGGGAPENLDQRIARLAPVKPNTVTNLVNAAVSANLNTYIDGETGVEYVGRFYGGSLYYVPTGNVYPPNN